MKMRDNNKNKQIPLVKIFMHQLARIKITKIPKLKNIRMYLTKLAPINRKLNSNQ